MNVRIEADGDLSAEEAAAVRAAVERYAAAADGSGTAVRGGWAEMARRESIRGHPPRPGGREAWQAARDRRRETGERANERRHIDR
jgi:hypothetical protein